MSNDQGPMMIAATTILRPPEARIGKIGNNITLPRTIPLRTGVAGIVGAIIGIPLALIIFSGPVESIIFGGIFGGFCGVAVVTYSPMKGESLVSWMGLSVLAARRKKVMYEGEEVQLAVGIARLSRGPLERIKVLGGAVEVNPDQFDERGVLRSPKNKNLLAARDVFANANPHASMSNHGGPPALAEYGPAPEPGQQAGHLGEDHGRGEGPKRRVIRPGESDAETRIPTDPQQDPRGVAPRPVDPPMPSVMPAPRPPVDHAPPTAPRMPRRGSSPEVATPSNQPPVAPTPGMPPPPPPVRPSPAQPRVEPLSNEPPRTPPPIRPRPPKRP